MIFTTWGCYFWFCIYIYICNIDIYIYINTSLKILSLFLSHYLSGKEHRERERVCVEKRESERESERASNERERLKDREWKREGVKERESEREREWERVKERERSFVHNNYIDKLIIKCTWTHREIKPFTCIISST